ncbi:MAG: LicD family protein [Pseudomonadota bacterium]
MIEEIPPELNLRNLKDIFERIQHLEAFVFFGTLLGYTRERNIIAHDDDIDIYVNRKHWRRLMRALAATNFSVEMLPPEKKSKPLRRALVRPWRRPMVMQATRMLDGVKTYADFYLYDARPKTHLIEKWNFRGVWLDPSTTIHVPKSMIFPLQAGTMQGIDIKLPARPEEVCAFLYGPSWRTPVKKNGGYVMEVVDHRPHFVPTGES